MFKVVGEEGVGAENGGGVVAPIAGPKSKLITY
jgi:hypothetical protein